jgi:succinate-semialdehyde dehydrogenase/glutarate-semialdehyde dehydrogenase
MSYNSVNPYSGELLKTFREHTDSEMEDALRRADLRFTSFGNLVDRTTVLKTAAALMVKRREPDYQVVTFT